MRRSIIYTLLLLFGLNILDAQDIDLYALGYQPPFYSHKSINSANVENDYFLRIDPYTGDETILTELKDIQLLAEGASTLHLAQNKYIFWGLETGNPVPNKVQIDLSTGETSTSLLDNRYPIDVQYDMRQQKLFGLKHSKKSSQLELVQITSNGTANIAKLDKIQHISVGNSTFDANRSFYIFMGVDEEYHDRLYTINTSNGKILDQPRIRNYYFNELQYDPKDDKLYGLARKKTNTSQFFFVEINLTTGHPVIIQPIHELFDIAIGVSAISISKGVYIFSGIDKTYNNRLYMIDLISGEVVSNQILQSRITEIHCDNNAYALEHFQQDFVDKGTLLGSLNPRDLNARAIKSVDDVLQLDATLTDETSVKATIVNIYGEIVFEKTITPTNGDLTSLDLTSLNAGIYFFKLKTSKGLITEKFMKR